MAGSFQKNKIPAVVYDWTWLSFMIDLICRDDGKKKLLTNQSVPCSAGYMYLTNCDIENYSGFLYQENQCPDLVKL